MATNTVGAYNQYGSADVGAYDFVVLIPAGVTLTALAGTAVTSEGAMRIALTTYNAAEAAGDVYINGIRHTSDGLMYATLDAAPQTGDVFINGLRHSLGGIRYIQTGDVSGRGPEGLACDPNGVMAYMIDPLTIVGYHRGFGIDVDGAVLLNT